MELTFDYKKLDLQKIKNTIHKERLKRKNIMALERRTKDQNNQKFKSVIYNNQQAQILNQRYKNKVYACKYANANLDEDDSASQCDTEKQKLMIINKQQKSCNSSQLSYHNVTCDKQIYKQKYEITKKKGYLNKSTMSIIKYNYKCRSLSKPKQRFSTTHNLSLNKNLHPKNTPKASYLHSYLKSKGIYKSK